VNVLQYIYLYSHTNKYISTKKKIENDNNIAKLFTIHVYRQNGKWVTEIQLGKTEVQRTLFACLINIHHFRNNDRFLVDISSKIFWNIVFIKYFGRSCLGFLFKEYSKT
jgi:hypothetical protein